MKKLRLTFGVLLFISGLAANAQKDFNVKFGGRVETYIFTDTYKGVESGGGLQYQFPARPQIDPIHGDDHSREGTLRFGIASTRLNVGADYKVSDKVSSNAFVEADFMGAGGSNPINIVRLRHAYFKLNFGKSSLLMGQTSHLQLVEEIAAPTVVFGSGYPINPLARPIQVRYSRQIIPFVNLDVAASMFPGTEGKMQSSAMTPDLSVRLMAGTPIFGVVGVAGGFKSLTPKTAVVADQHQRMNAWNASVFGMMNFARRFTVRAFLIWGQDLQSLGMTGFFAPTLDRGAYLPTGTISTWGDLNANLGNGFQTGIFLGYQKNLGTCKPIDVEQMVGPADQIGVEDFYRIAPRLWYNLRKFSFGLEYLFTQASWGKEFDSTYRPTSYMPSATNHRVMLLGRFNF